MAGQKENNPKRKTQVRELPKKEKQLTADEQKKIKGGPIQSGWLPAMATPEKLKQ